MQHEYITTPQQLENYCQHLANAPIIAFDTEFVSEDSYRPDLCLIQVAAADQLAVIDPSAVGDVSAFWELLVSPGQQTIVHSGREELRFCLHATGKRPHDLFDVQIAAGLIGLEYPASYGTLVSRLLNTSLAKGETRTDWRRRPLTPRQIEYALQDVLYLGRVRDLLYERLDRLGRLSWLRDEMEAWQQQIEAFENNEQWHRVSGTAGLTSRGLAIVRELWRWREGEAKRRNCTARRVLRDDLIVELAKRQSADPKRIRAVRGLERRHLLRHMTELAECIEKALAIPDAFCPTPPKKTNTPQVNLLSQFLTTALGSICHAAQVAPSIVGTAQDVRELIAFRLGMLDGSNPPPVLATGWREEVVGQVIEDLIDGKLAIRIIDPFATDPLAFERLS